MGTKRPVVIHGEIAFVPLTKGLIAVIDVVDAPAVDLWDWYALKSDDGFRAARKLKDGSHLLLHRAIVGAPDDVFVDHRDGDQLNNRRSNLREASAQQNSWNAKPRRSKSGHRGVTWFARRQKWMVRITFNGQLRLIGLFDELPEAAAAYKAAEQERRGEFGFYAR